MDDQPGVTRDRQYASIHWKGIPLTLIDTGGFENIGQDPLLDQVRDQVEFAVAEADLFIFMMDGRQGLLPGDEEIAHMLRLAGKKIFAVINKIDGPELEHLMHDFFKLGIDKIYPISAAHGYGLNSLMEEVSCDLTKPEAHRTGGDQIRVAILGRPNVGKSSLINRILGSDRLLVSNLPGTTRDSIDSLYHVNNREYLLIDTAGLRRKGKVKDKIDKFSMIKAVKSLDRCHIAIVLLNAEEGITEQDARICGYAFDRGRGIVLAVNKWDLIKKDLEKKRFLDQAIDRQLRFTAFAPRINLSALTGEKVNKLFEKIDLIFDQFSIRVSTGKVNRVIEDVINRKPPPITGRGRFKLLYATQTRSKPPTFVIFVNRPEMVHFSYKRFLMNQLREHFDLNHSPIKIIFRKKNKA